MICHVNREKQLILTTINKKRRIVRSEKTDNSMQKGQKRIKDKQQLRKDNVEH